MDKIIDEIKLMITQITNKAVDTDNYNLLLWLEPHELFYVVCILAKKYSLGIIIFNYIDDERVTINNLADIVFKLKNN